MKIRSVDIKDFRRFESLKIPDLPPAKLVVMAGPNGSGKSSLFDAFSVWKQVRWNRGLNWESSYHSRSKEKPDWSNQVNIEFHTEPKDPKKAFYLRSAYRNDPEFNISSVNRLGDPTIETRVRKMIEQDATVSQNYQRLVADALQHAFETADENSTLKEFRAEVIGEIRSSILRLFPDLDLNTLGNPMEQGTFRFDKGKSKAFGYQNLSGGEKAAFDLLVDMVVKRRTFDDTVFAIDEPEAHMNTRLQGALLDELFNLIPDGSQMWIATHSIGMMRTARKLYEGHTGDVIFLDFEDHDFDEEVTLRPVVPNRQFWERVLRVALDDLAELVAPREIVICEGNPKGAVTGKHEEHDARCFDTIFAEEFPDTKFVSGGSSKEIESDRLRFAALLPNVIKGLRVRRLIDRDDHPTDDVAEMLEKGIQTLGRRNLESYLYDEEVLQALYEKEGRLDDFPSCQSARANALSASEGRGFPSDDVKAAARDIYLHAKRELKLTACGNDERSFARTVLAPLIKPGMKVYEELKKDIFGLGVS